MNILQGMRSKAGPFAPATEPESRPMRHLPAILVAFLALAGSAAAQEQDGLLPVEQAFALEARIDAPGSIALHWEIAPDYYLYRSRIKAKTTQPGLTLGALDLPDGERKHDEFLGDVEVYHHALDATLPYTRAAGGTGPLSVTLTVQGCHEVDPKICYPPHPVTLSLAEPAGASIASDAGATPFGSASDGSSLVQLGGPTGGSDAAPLPPEQAFVFEAIAQSPTALLARWTMPKGYYLYRDKTVLSLSDASGVRLGAPQWPQGVPHTDEHFGTVEVYFDQVELPLPLARENGAARTVRLHAEYQGCQDNGLCYPVMAHDVAVELPPATDAQLAAADAAFVPAAAVAAPAANDNALRSTPPEAGFGTLLGVLLLALAGGLILNLMPCVLPVLSLKVLGLAQSGESAAKARTHALWYTAGVLVAFSAVGLAVIGLRAAGNALGWGFQLQQPVFVAVLVYVLFAIGLSLSGVFTLGAGLAGVGQSLGNRSGPAGDFFTGVLAVVVASPCTAPFMGTALAYAFAASSALALLVFLALGLGLALPFLLVGFVPGLAKRLPRPGAWMETLKQFLAFPMYLTAVWLVWVLGNQRGIDAVAWVLLGATLLALGMWWWERSRWGGRLAPQLLAGAVLLVALVPLLQVALLPPPTANAATVKGDSVPYSAGRLADLRAQGRGVFVDIGADWCVTCKVNEKAVIDTAAFRDLLARTDTVLMTGDWTNVDPAITAFLQEYKAVGVPLYVVFRPGEPGKPLPTVLTQGIVADALGGS